MSQRVKCEFCWKVFEIPEDSIGKKRQCPFCQRMTKGKLIKNNELAEKEEVQTEPEKQSNTMIIKLLVGLLAVLTLLNIFNMSLSLSKRNYPELMKEMLQENPEWKINLENNMKNLKKEVDSIETQLKSIDSKIDVKNVVPKLIEGLSPSVKLAREKIIEMEEKIKKIEKLLEKLKKEKENLENRVNNLNKK